MDRFELDTILRPVKGKIHALDTEALRKVSDRIREFVLEYAPEVVNAAEGFAEDVTYIPGSATGCPPEQIGNSFLFRPRDLDPMWIEVPALLALQKSTRLVRGAVRRKTARQGTKKK